MKKTIISLSLLASAMTMQAQDKNFHIYLAFGQSNMEGNAKIEQQDTEGVSERFQVMNTTDCAYEIGSWRIAIPPLCRCYTGLTPCDYFGRTMVEYLPENVKVGVINVAVGGASIDLFDTDKCADYIAKQDSWMQNIIKAYDNNPYEKLVELGKKAKKDGVIKGILLHQGETNTGDAEWPKNVKKIYDRLISDLDLNAEDVPLLAGELGYESDGGSCGKWMNPVINTLPSVIPTAHVVRANGCPITTDKLHFTAEGYRKLGKRYAHTMLDLMGIEYEEDSDETEIEDGYTDFSSMTSYSMWAGGETKDKMSFEDNALKISNPEATTNFWDLQYIAVDNLSTTEGTEYKVTMMIKGSKAGSIHVGLGTWSQLATNSASFTTDWQEVTCYVSDNVPTSSSSHLLLQHGDFVGDVYLKWVKVTHNGSKYGSVMSKNITVNGVARNMLTYAPKNLPDNSPLVISLHGYNQDAAYQREQTQWESVADTAMFVVVFPNGINKSWDTSGETDTKFIEAIIDEMSNLYNIDRERVYLTGFSLGAMMTYHSITKLGDKIAAFGPVSGVPFDNREPSAPRPVPIIHTHCKGDNVFYYDGDANHAAGGYPAIPDYMKKWAVYDGCTNVASPLVISPYPASKPQSVATYTCYSGADNGIEVALISIEGKGHWHSNDPANVITTEEIWNFCKRYTLKGIIDSGISQVTQDRLNTNDDTIYNMCGQRVEACSFRGIYIKNGKKIVLR